MLSNFYCPKEKTRDKGRAYSGHKVNKFEIFIHPYYVQNDMANGVTKIYNTHRNMNKIN